jgi:hypothetical protein
LIILIMFDEDSSRYTLLVNVAWELTSLYHLFCLHGHSISLREMHVPAAVIMKIGILPAINSSNRFVSAKAREQQVSNTNRSVYRSSTHARAQPQSQHCRELLVYYEPSTRLHGVTG